MNNFKLYEFFNGIEIYNYYKLMNDKQWTDKLLKWWRIMNDIRDQFGKPIRITSTWRSEKHNIEVGGSKKSQHLTFDAIDFIPVCPLDINEQQNIMKIYRNMCRATIIATNARTLTIGQVIFYPYKFQIHIAYTCERYKSRQFWYGYKNGWLRPITEIKYSEEQDEFFKNVINNLEEIE